MMSVDHHMIKGEFYVLFHYKSQLKLRKRPSHLEIDRACSEGARVSAYHPFFTKDRESTAHLVHRLCTEKAPAVIVAVGGDGTVNDVLNGLTNFEQVTFAYIPSGSGNDLARGLHLETNPLKALEQILSGGQTGSIRIGELSTPAFSRRFLVSSLHLALMPLSVKVPSIQNSKNF